MIFFAKNFLKRLKWTNPLNKSPPILNSVLQSPLLQHVKRTHLMWIFGNQFSIIRFLPHGLTFAPSLTTITFRNKHLPLNSKSVFQMIFIWVHSFLFISLHHWHGYKFQEWKPDNTHFKWIFLFSTWFFTLFWWLENYFSHQFILMWASVEFLHKMHVNFLLQFRFHLP